MGTRAWLIVALVCVATAFACDDDGGATASDTGSPDGGGDGATGDGGDVAPDTAPDAGAGFEIGEVAWEPCALGEAGTDTDGECAEVDVPLDWDDPEGETITLFVRRSPALGAVAGQIWLIPGGPGFSCSTSGPSLQFIGEAHPSYDVYCLDHRGVGQSTRLGCADGESAEGPSGTFIEDAEWPDCLAAVVAEWGDGLAHFSATQAARDYGALIEATRPITGDVVLWGVSYGGYLTFRFLQLFPDDVTAVVLDSPAAPGANLDDFAAQFDAVGEALMDLCGEDEFCSGKLGEDPWAVAQAVVADTETACPELDVDPLDLRRSLGWLVEQPNPWDGTAPSMVYRIQRCDPADVEAVERVVYLLSQSSPIPLEQWSTVLSNHIMFSELWDDHEATVQDRVDAEMALTVSNGLAFFLTPALDGWPLYEEPLAGQWPETDIPMLILAAPLDARTPIAGAREAAARYDGPNQQVVELANARHPAGATSFVGGGLACGFQLGTAFIDDPTGDLDTSCLEQLLPPDFAGTAALADVLYGTDDLWENE